MGTRISRTPACVTTGTCPDDPTRPVTLCCGCDLFVCTATPDSPEWHTRCRHGAIWGSLPAYDKVGAA